MGATEHFLLLLKITDGLVTKKLVCSLNAVDYLLILKTVELREATLAAGATWWPVAQSPLAELNKNVIMHFLFHRFGFVPIPPAAQVPTAN